MKLSTALAIGAAALLGRHRHRHRLGQRLRLHLRRVEGRDGDQHGDLRPGVWRKLQDEDLPDVHRPDGPDLRHFVFPVQVGFRDAPDHRKRSRHQHRHQGRQAQAGHQLGHLRLHRVLQRPRNLRHGADDRRDRDPRGPGSDPVHQPLQPARAHRLRPRLPSVQVQVVLRRGWLHRHAGVREPRHADLRLLRRPRLRKVHLQHPRQLHPHRALRPLRNLGMHGQLQRARHPGDQRRSLHPGLRQRLFRLHLHQLARRHRDRRRLGGLGLLHLGLHLDLGRAVHMRPHRHPRHGHQQHVHGGADVLGGCGRDDEEEGQGPRALEASGILASESRILGALRRGIQRVGRCFG